MLQYNRRLFLMCYFLVVARMQTGCVLFSVSCNSRW